MESFATVAVSENHHGVGLGCKYKLPLDLATVTTGTLPRQKGKRAMSRGLLEGVSRYIRPAASHEEGSGPSDALNTYEFSLRDFISNPSTHLVSVLYYYLHETSWACSRSSIVVVVVEVPVLVVKLSNKILRFRSGLCCGR